jgi:hypothetical protein
LRRPGEPPFCDHMSEQLSRSSKRIEPLSGYHELAPARALANAGFGLSAGHPGRGLMREIPPKGGIDF